MKKTYVLIAILVAIVIGAVMIYRDHPTEVYLQGVEQDDGTMRYEDDDMTVIVDWNYLGDEPNA